MVARDRIELSTLRLSVAIRGFSKFVFPAGARARSRTTVGADGEAQKVYEDRHMLATLHNACERIRENAGIDDHNSHNLRRTAGATMAELGVPRFIVERVLNPTDRTVTSVYIKSEYVAGVKEQQKILDEAERLLERTFDFHHTTIQDETVPCTRRIGTVVRRRAPTRRGACITVVNGDRPI